MDIKVDVHSLSKGESLNKRVEQLTTFLNRDVESEKPNFIIIDDYQSQIPRKTKNIVICICDRKVYIDTYYKLPDCRPIKNLRLSDGMGRAHSHIHQATWRKDKFSEMVKQQP